MKKAGAGEAKEPCSSCGSFTTVHWRHCGTLASDSAPAAERVTSDTGGQKDRKRAQLGALAPDSLQILAEVAGHGGQKYARYNFLKGYDWSLSWDAMQRHALAFWAGEDLDPESGLPHMAHAAWHALNLVTQMRRHPEYDDRPPPLEDDDEEDEDVPDFSEFWNKVYEEVVK